MVAFILEGIHDEPPILESDAG